MISILSLSRSRLYRFSSSKRFLPGYKFGGVSHPTKNSSLISEKEKKFHQFSLPISKLTLRTFVVGGSQSREYIDLPNSKYKDKSANDEDHTLNSKTTPTTNQKATPIHCLREYEKVKLSLQVGETWTVKEDSCTCTFEQAVNADEEEEEHTVGGAWKLKVGVEIDSKVSADMKMKKFEADKKVELVVDQKQYSLQFPSDADLKDFGCDFQEHLTDNGVALEATEEKPEESH